MILKVKLFQKYKRKPDIPHSENNLDEPLLKDFPKLRKLSKSNNYINLWIIGEKNEKVNYISDSFSIEPTEIYVKDKMKKKNWTPNFIQFLKQISLSK